MNDEFLTYLNGLESRAAKIEHGQISFQWYVFGGLIVCCAFLILGYSSLWHLAIYIIPAFLAVAAAVCIAGPPHSLRNWQRRRPVLMQTLRQRVFDGGMLADYLHKRTEERLRVSEVDSESLERFIAYFMGETHARSLRFGYGNPDNDDNPLLRAALMLMLAQELRQGYELFDESLEHTDSVIELPEAAGPEDELRESRRHGPPSGELWP